MLKFNLLDQMVDDFWVVEMSESIAVIKSSERWKTKNCKSRDLKKKFSNVRKTEHG